MGSLKSEISRLLKENDGFRYAIAGLIELEEILKRLDRHEAELVKLREDMDRLREDMNEGFQLLRRHIDALGARWGLLAEESFRAGMVGVEPRLAIVSPFVREEAKKLAKELGIDVYTSL